MKYQLQIPILKIVKKYATPSLAFKKFTIELENRSLIHIDLAKKSSLLALCDKT